MNAPPSFTNEWGGGECGMSSGHNNKGLTRVSRRTEVKTVVLLFLEKTQIDGSADPSETQQVVTADVISQTWKRAKAYQKSKKEGF